MLREGAAFFLCWSAIVTFTSFVASHTSGVIISSALPFSHFAKWRDGIKLAKAYRYYT